MTSMRVTAGSAPGSAGSSQPGFQLRISTALLLFAVVSLAGAWLVGRIGSHLAKPPLETIAVVLGFGVWPLTTIAGTVAAGVSAIRFRRPQFVFELVLGAVLLVILWYQEWP